MSHINGPLHAEAMGPVDAPPMVFVHPNPMDSAAWLFQMAHFSTWYRCVGVDLPGYGRSPSAAEGLTMEDLADACWEAADRHGGAGRAVLVGCSVGSSVVQHMYHRAPARTDALVLCGAGYSAQKEFVHRRIAAYTDRGLGYRYDYALEDLSPAFRATPFAHWLATLFSERNDAADLETIILMFRALGMRDPDWLQRDLHAPTLVLNGGLDRAHATAGALVERLPQGELSVIEGAGHACQLEQPWAFDAEMIRFLRAHGHGWLPETDA